MLDTLPGHIGNVEETVNAAEINECTVIGKILDSAGNNLTFLKLTKNGLTIGIVLGFDNGTAGNNHVVPLLIKLDNLEFQRLLLNIAGIANRTNVNKRTRQEGTDTLNGYGKAALDLVFNNAHNDLVVLKGFFQLAPGFNTLSFVT